MITWGAPVAIILLFLVILGARWQESNPLAWAGDRMDQGVALVETISENFEPQLVIVMTPIAGNNSGPVALALAPAVEVSANTVQVAAAQPEAADSTVVVSTVADEIAALGIGGGSEELATADQPVEPSAPVESVALVVEAPTSPPEQPAPAATAVPPTPEAPTPVPPPQTPQPTQMQVFAAPTATSTPPGLAVLALSSDTRSVPTPTWTPMATAAASGAVLAFLPTPTAAPVIGGRAAQPIVGTAGLIAVEATATPVAYQVRAGDTLVVIADRYDVSVEALMAANEIGTRDVTRIQPGRMLIVPVPTPTPSPFRADAPVLLGPADAVDIACQGETNLSWERVLYVQDSDKYLLHVGFVSGVDEGGAERVTWVVAQLRPVTMTEWTLDNTLCNLAPQAYDRQWRWWVEVVAEQEGSLVSVSPPSPVWGFRWD